MGKAKWAQVLYILCETLHNNNAEGDLAKPFTIQHQENFEIRSPEGSAKS